MADSALKEVGAELSAVRAGLYRDEYVSSDLRGGGGGGTSAAVEAEPEESYRGQQGSRMDFQQQKLGAPLGATKRPVLSTSYSAVAAESKGVNRSSALYQARLAKTSEWQTAVKTEGGSGGPASVGAPGGQRERGELDLNALIQRMPNRTAQAATATSGRSREGEEVAPSRGGGFGSGEVIQSRSLLLQQQQQGNGRDRERERERHVEERPAPPTATVSGSSSNERGRLGNENLNMSGRSPTPAFGQGVLKVQRSSSGKETEKQRQHGGGAVLHPRPGSGQQEKMRDARREERSYTEEDDDEFDDDEDEDEDEMDGDEMDEDEEDEEEDGQIFEDAEEGKNHHPQGHGGSQDQGLRFAPPARGFERERERERGAGGTSGAVSEARLHSDRDREFGGESDASPLGPNQFSIDASRPWPRPRNPSQIARFSFPGGTVGGGNEHLAGKGKEREYYTQAELDHLIWSIQQHVCEAFNNNLHQLKGQWMECLNEERMTVENQKRQWEVLKQAFDDLHVRERQQRDTLRQYDTQVSEQSDALKAAHSRIVQYEHENQDLRNDHERTRAKNVEQERELAALRAQVESSAGNVDRASAHARRLEVRIGDLESDLERAREAKRIADRDLAVAVDGKMEEERQRQILQESLRLGEERSRQQQAVISRQASEFEEMQKEERRQRREKEEAIEERDRETAKREIAEKQIALLETEAKEKERQRRLDAQEIQQLTVDRDNARLEISKTKSEVEGLRLEIQKLRAQVDVQTREISDLKGLLNRQRLEISSLSAELVEQKQQNVKLKRQAQMASSAVPMGRGGSSSSMGLDQSSRDGAHGGGRRWSQQSGGVGGEGSPPQPDYPAGMSPRSKDWRERATTSGGGVGSSPPVPKLQIGGGGGAFASLIGGGRGDEGGEPAGVSPRQRLESYHVTAARLFGGPSEPSPSTAVAAERPPAGAKAAGWGEGGRVSPRPSPAGGAAGVSSGITETERMRGGRDGGGTRAALQGGQGGSGRNSLVAPAPFGRDEEKNLDEEILNKELLDLNIERQAIESELAKYPHNSAGRTIAGRRRKAEMEERLAEVERGISRIRASLRGKAKSTAVGSTVARY
uniref:Enkurin domain-containing protein n=1 Tax=Chromera velia CCMP2878 TaxID=1169474 RepID=A0A0G4IEV9_9ALVE|eukprot:Cvel_13862.t1-p1 / transcript=Cvel_13862.t1 / gene=Cvel_13862 / organism=Chromera_velia_CCMP2878 / gene_product=Myosin-2 heavy chain, non muscle, putative / transcript_product=Myosin-2 heavy chain, non muscle, putative / location=Cvel_scaffold963:48204-60415(-) / protein_length=1094 / sequence_SO=supercontig / SO=protein_coding / is_pseudo=false